tara:strand:- start:645 stop:995 length:351 start_codon:yes stop_codon:yes gene_type:complete
MNRPPAVLWIAVVLLLLVPTAAGRLLLDLAGGLLLTLLALPLILSGLGWIGWKLLQSRMITCTACGATGLKGAGVCSFCGTPYPNAADNTGVSAAQSTPARDLTIDVIAQDVDSDS